MIIGLPSCSNPVKYMSRIGETVLYARPGGFYFQNPCIGTAVGRGIKEVMDGCFWSRYGRAHRLTMPPLSSRVVAKRRKERKAKSVSRVDFFWRWSDNHTYNRC